MTGLLSWSGMAEVNINKLEEDLYRRGDKAGAIGSMYSRFYRQVQTAGILKDVKKHESFMKPSEKKRRKHREAVARLKKKERKDAVYQKGNKGSFRS